MAPMPGNQRSPEYHPHQNTRAPPQRTDHKDREIRYPIPGNRSRSAIDQLLHPRRHCFEETRTTRQKEQHTRQQRRTKSRSSIRSHIQIKDGVQIQTEQGGQAESRRITPDIRTTNELFQPGRNRKTTRLNGNRSDWGNRSKISDGN